MTITLKTSLGTEFGLFSNNKFYRSLWYGTKLDLFILKQTNISIKLRSFQPGIQIYFLRLEWLQFNYSDSLWPFQPQKIYLDNWGVEISDNS